MINNHHDGDVSYLPTFPVPGVAYTVGQLRDGQDLGVTTYRDGNDLTKDDLPTLRKLEAELAGNAAILGHGHPHAGQLRAALSFVQIRIMLIENKDDYAELRIKIL